MKEYDDSNPVSIEKYAKKLIGKTFADVCEEDKYSYPSEIHEESEYRVSHENKRRKGGLGELIEERYFHYAANNDARADFEKAGVELKVTPYKINKNNTRAAKERLILTKIDYNAVVNESFEESHFWEKSRLILLIYYLYQKEIKNRLDYRIDYVKLFTPPDKDLEIIKQDYYTIVNKIKAGKAHELSESDTLYLGAATKAATSEDVTTQPYSDVPAKPRAFAFKNSYMTYVLNKYIIPGKNTYEPILKDDSKSNDLEDFVTERIDSFKGYTIEKLCEKFEIDISKRKPKNLESMLAYRILGVNNNKAEEFEKANIVVKTIRLTNKNTISESMSFPTIKYKELVEETWDDSKFGNYLRETRFLFVVYKYDKNNDLRLLGSQFWNIPYKDLEENVRKVWEKTKKVLLDGLEIVQTSQGRRTNFPKATENPVCHVRPHATTVNDVCELPDGRSYTKHCFWLNKSYILSQLDDKFKKD